MKKVKTLESFERDLLVQASHPNGYLIPIGSDRHYSAVYLVSLGFCSSEMVQEGDLLRIIATDDGRKYVH